MDWTGHIPFLVDKTKTKYQPKTGESQPVLPLGVRCKTELNKWNARVKSQKLRN